MGMHDVAQGGVSLLTNVTLLSCFVSPLFLFSQVHLGWIIEKSLMGFFGNLRHVVQEMGRCVFSNVGIPLRKLKIWRFIKLKIWVNANNFNKIASWIMLLVNLRNILQVILAFCE